MTLDEARRILGLGPNEAPDAHLKDFQDARGRIAEMVRTAPNPTLAARYHAGLTEFDRALATLAPAAVAHVPVPVPVPELEPAPVVEPVVAITPAPEPPPASEPVAPLEPIVASVPTAALPAAVVESTPVFRPTVVSNPVVQPQPVVLSQAVVVTPAVVASHIGAAPPPALPVPAPDPLLVATLAPVVPVATFAPPELATAPAYVPPPAPVVVATPEPEAEAALLAVAAAPTQGLPIDIATPTQPLPAEAKAAVKRKKNPSRPLIWALGVLLFGVGGGYAYLLLEEDKRLERSAEIAKLENQGYHFIDDHKWAEARAIVEKIEALDPGSEIAMDLRRSLEIAVAEGKKESRHISHDSSSYAFDFTRPDQMSRALSQIIALGFAIPGAVAATPDPAPAAATEKFSTELAAARKSLAAHEWEAAITTAAAILNQAPDQPEAKAILAEASTGKDREPADLAKARELLATAKQHDTGKYDAAGYAAIHQAALLAPKDPEIRALSQKLSSYPRTLKVPGDFASAAEALADAHDHDRVILAEGTSIGPLVVNSAVELQGAGADKSLVQCPALDGAAITFGPDAKGAHVSGLKFRHSSLDTSGERFSAALVRGGDVTFSDCQFTEGAGHGLAVIDGGQAIASKCRFSSNGWDGASASGSGSRLEVRDSEVTNNIEHGLDVWGGASGTFTGNRCEGNSRNGILIDAGPATVTVTGNQVRNNRECGIDLTRGTLGKVTGNLIGENRLGGLVIRTEATRLEVTGNKIHSNTPCLVLEKGVPRAPYEQNELSSDLADHPTLIVENVDFSAVPPEPEPVPEVTPPPKPTTPAPTKPKTPTKTKKKS